MSGCMQRKSLGLIVLASVGLACSDPVTGPLNTLAVAPSVSTMPTALSSPGWQEKARGLVATTTPFMSPMASGRMYGVLSVAQYLAVTGVDGGLRADGSLAGHGLGSGGRALLEARRGAVAGASAEVLTFFFPAAAGALEDRVSAEANAGPGGVYPHFARGLEIGRDAGRVMVARAKADGFTTPWTGTLPTGPGIWAPVPGTAPAGSTLLRVPPYVLTSNDQFRSTIPMPPAFGSDEFLAAVAEVRAISDTRSDAQLVLARLWNYPGGTHTPPGEWNLIASNYILADAMDERAATHVFALMHAAIADATNACWDAKLHFLVVRPSQADPLISVPLGLPNHPSYPSGHSCVSAAARTVLANFFPDAAHTVQLNDWVRDAGLSRVYGGIHFSFDVLAGQNLGDAVGRMALSVDRSRGIVADLR